MKSLLETGPGILLVLILPGVLVLAIARVRLTVIEALALVPICSIGALWLLAEVCLVLGAPYAPPAFAVLMAAMVIAVVVLAWRGSLRTTMLVFDFGSDGRAETANTGPDAERTRDAGARLKLWVSVGLLAVSVLLGASIWLRGGMLGPAQTPPGLDAPQHSFFVARIARAESIAPDDVLVSDPRGGSPAAAYYPLAMHAPLAIVNRITGSDVSWLMDDMVLGFAAFVLPLGLFALVRDLAPDLPLAAGLAAFLAMLLGLFPYEPLFWGSVNTIVGVAMIPVILVVVLRTVVARLAWTSVALSALLVTTLLATHNSELVPLVLLVFLLLAERAVRDRSVEAFARPVGRLSVVGIVAAVLAIPGAATIFGGVSERTTVVLAPTVSFGTALRDIAKMAPPGGPGVSPPAVALAVLAAIGLVWMLMRGRLVAWAVGAGIVLALCVLAAISHGSLSKLVTFPWYRQSMRIAFYFTLFVPVFAACALALAADLLGSLSRAHARWAEIGGITVVLAFMLIFVARPSTNDNHRFVKLIYTSGLIERPEVAAFHVLAKDVPSTGLIVNDGTKDANVWMYALAGANPMLALHPAGAKYTQLRSYRERSYIQTHLLALGHDAKLERLLRKYHVHYVYFGDRTFYVQPTWTLAQLRGVPRLHETFDRGGAHIFRIAAP